MLFSIFILCDRKTGLKYNTHYEALPKAVTGCPLFWNDDELSFLEGSYILKMIEERKSKYKEEYERICNIDIKFKINTIDEYILMRILVCSRIYKVEINNKDEYVMIPCADMFNHSNEANATFYFSDPNFHIKMLKKACVDEPINISYGVKSNTQLLLNYGFTLYPNIATQYCPNDIHITVEINSNTSYEYKKFLEKCNIPMKESFFLTSQYYDNETTLAFSFISFTAEKSPLIFTDETVFVLIQRPGVAEKLQLQLFRTRSVREGEKNNFCK